MPRTISRLSSARHEYSSRAHRAHHQRPDAILPVDLRLEHEREDLLQVLGQETLSFCRGHAGRDSSLPLLLVALGFGFLRILPSACTWVQVLVEALLVTCVDGRVFLAFVLFVGLALAFTCVDGRAFTSGVISLALVALFVLVAFTAQRRRCTAPAAV